MDNDSDADWLTTTRMERLLSGGSTQQPSPSGKLSLKRRRMDMATETSTRNDDNVVFPMTGRSRRLERIAEKLENLSLQAPGVSCGKATDPKILKIISASSSNNDSMSWDVTNASMEERRGPGRVPSLETNKWDQPNEQTIERKQLTHWKMQCDATDITIKLGKNKVTIRREL